MSAPLLPQEFSELTRFVPKWALTNEKDRFFALTGSNLHELRMFHDAMLRRCDEIAAHLDRFPVDRLPADAQTLFDLVMTFVEVAHPIDLKWKGTDIEDVFPVSKMEFLGPSSDGPRSEPQPSERK